MDLTKVKIKTAKVLNKYLYYILNSEFYLMEARKFSTGNNVKHLDLNIILSIFIPLPLSHIQQQIIDQFEKKHKIIEANKKTVKLFEAKLKTKLDSLWQ